jgi:hypothetical protein
VRISVLRVLLAAPSDRRSGWSIGGKAPRAVNPILDRVAAEGCGRIGASRAAGHGVRLLAVGLVAALTFSFSFLLRTSAGADDAPPQLAALIDQLDDDDYAVRERATRRLSETADIATIDRLTAAWRAGSLETSWRAAAVLRGLATSKDVAACDAVVRVLEGQVDSPRRHVARQAAELLRLVGPNRRERTIRLLRRWGADVEDRGNGRLDVRLRSDWQGGEQALEHVPRLEGVTLLQLNHPSVTDAALEIVAACNDLEALYLGGSSIDADGLRRLRELSSLRYLSLKGLPLDDASIANLAGLTALEQLGLDDTPLGDDALTHLRGMSNLRVLWLNNTKVTDDGLALLEHLPHLEKLVLTQTPLKGPGLEHLAKAPRLRYLSLQGVPLRDGAVPYLGRVTQLTSLGLDGTRVGDAGLKYLAPLKNLKVLWLNDTPVTDAGVEHLEKLTSLESLFLPGTKVSPEGVRRLRRALPRCRVAGPDGDDISRISP